MSQDTSRSLRSHELLSSSSLLGRLKHRYSPQTTEAIPLNTVAPKSGPPPPPPRTGLKRKLGVPIDVDAADFSFDSLAPHVGTLLFPSFKDRQTRRLSLTFLKRLLCSLSKAFSLVWAYWAKCQSLLKCMRL